jgi:hypothetical protein
MDSFSRPTPVRRLRSFRIGLILLLLLGAPLNLALPDAMAGMPQSGTMAASNQSSTCPEPNSSSGDRDSHHDHSCLCLFCTALGGPSLAGASVQLAVNASAAPIATISFDLSDTELSGGLRARTQCCRGPPAAV